MRARHVLLASWMWIGVVACDDGAPSTDEPEVVVEPEALPSVSPEGEPDGEPEGEPDASDGGVVLDDAGVTPEDDAGLPAECDLAQPMPEGDRVVVVSHPFSNEIRTAELKSTGDLVDIGDRTTTAESVRQLAFTPNGQVLLSLGEDGTLTSYIVNDTDLVQADTLSLPTGPGYDVRIEVMPQGDRVFIVAFNSQADGGIHEVSVDCDGLLVHHADRFVALRLVQSVTLTPDATQLIVAGGQAVFDPIDDDDLRIYDVTDDGLVENAAFDIYTDFVTTPRIAMRDDGLIAVPNGSPFSEEGAQLRLVQKTDDVLAQVDLVENITTIREAVFAPGGDILLVSRDEDNAVSWLKEDANGWALDGTAEGIGLADQMTLLRRGPLSGHVFLAATNSRGNIAHIVVEDDTVTSRVPLDLGEGSQNIPWAIAVQP